MCIIYVSLRGWKEKHLDLRVFHLSSEKLLHIIYGFVFVLSIFVRDYEIKIRNAEKYWKIDK